ncbi:MAG: glycosyltransferase family 2 protein [Trichloromonas sp.]|nr:glycosyltransferase family 2 protein [Trichloromonas sp.]
MLFSVVIPAYNYASFLPRAIDSVLAQPGGDFEIIVADDGSTDATPAIGTRYRQEYPERVRYLRQENGGPAKARNRGIEEARGDFLIFLDADDRLLPDALARFRPWAQEKRWGMVCAGHQSRHADGKVRLHSPPPLSEDRLSNFSAYLRREFGISNGATLVARRVFDVIRYPETLRNSEDIPVFAQTLALFDCRSFPEPVLEVFKHDDSLRHNIDLVMQAGAELAEILFDGQLLPPRFLALRGEFEARNALSLFRSLHLAGRYAEARLWFHQAARRSPRLLWKWSYLSKYLRGYFKG